MQNEIGDKGIGFDMKLFHFIFLFILLLAACQSVTATPASPINTLTAATSTPQKVVSKSTGTPTATPTPTGPVVHKSGSDTNASNLIIVSDQFIVNNSLTIDSITASEAGWIVLYLDKQGKSGGLQFGPEVTYAPIQAGKSSHVAIPLSQNFNQSINPSSLPGTLLDVVLQTNPSNPNTMLRNNNVIVKVQFTILTNNKNASFVPLSTATPLISCKTALAIIARANSYRQ